MVPVGVSAKPGPEADQTARYTTVGALRSELHHIRKVLRRLVEQGVVHHGLAGYVLNREHAAGPNLADGLADALEQWAGNRGQVVVLTRHEARMLRDEGRSIVDSWRRDLQMLLGDRSEILG